MFPHTRPSVIPYSSGHGTIAGNSPVIPLNTPDEDEEITVVLEEVEDRGQQQHDRTLSTSDIMQIRQLIARAKTMGF